MATKLYDLCEVLESYGNIRIQVFLDMIPFDFIDVANFLEETFCPVLHSLSRICRKHISAKSLCLSKKVNGIIYEKA
jgi:hypothetical protein